MASNELETIRRDTCSKGAVIAVASLLTLFLAAIHILGGKRRFLDVIPRSRWLSGASGVSVAYVFVHVLPDLAESQHVMREEAGEVLGFLEHHVYLLALLGMMVFYGLERLVKRSHPQAAKSDSDGKPMEAGVFWIHVGSFAAYNLLIGYLLLHREQPGGQSLLFFFLAMATHFLVNDYGLRQDHPRRYHHIGRWVLGAAVVAGSVVGATLQVHRAAIAMLFAFLAGGIVLNVLKEELPEERQSNFWAFAAGAVGYAALLMAL
jgi:hypothetical protein